MSSRIVLKRFVVFGLCVALSPSPSFAQVSKTTESAVPAQIFVDGAAIYENQILTLKFRITSVTKPK